MRWTRERSELVKKLVLLLRPKLVSLEVDARKTDLNNAKKVACPFSQFPSGCNTIGRFCSVYHTASIDL